MGITSSQQNKIAVFFQKESTPGVTLLFATLIALIFANSALSSLYEGFLNYPLGVAFGDGQMIKPVSKWINDGLMAIFFLVVGLEIKKELIQGDLSSFKKAILPLVGAVGGMLVPALIYLYFNHSDPTAIRGWAIPSATDIAFAVGVLSLFGKRLPISLKIFLLALAVLDDMGAVIIIAIFYTEQIILTPLLLAGLSILLLLLMGRLKVASIGLYLLIGFFLWLCVLKSGVHATIAGVTLGLLIPLNIFNAKKELLCISLEHALKPWVNYLIMPVFAFANAGVVLSGITPQSWLEPVTMGILLGLFIGKQLGIFSFVWLAIKLKIGEKPQHASWAQLYAVSMIAGIGFTMSLFIGILAFPDPAWQTDVKLGVLSGSLLSAVLGYILLDRFTPKKVQ
jgi:NhaA family Na+:H+ antiporter